MVTILGTRFHKIYTSAVHRCIYTVHGYSNILTTYRPIMVYIIDSQKSGTNGRYPKEVARGTKRTAKH